VVAVEEMAAAVEAAVEVFPKLSQSLRE